MSPQVALLFCLAFIGWLLYRDYRQHKKVSPALWIPLLWLIIIGSRPFSVWFGYGSGSASGDEALEGSPFDRLFFLSLIVAGVVVLARRRVKWRRIARTNGWLLVFFLYLGLSVAWSDFPLVSLKRWIKDLGNVVMVLLILTEVNPVRAVQILLLRCCYLFIPVSVLLIKYYPDWGRYYSPWDGKAYYCGVSSDKNMLGMTIFACALTLIWVLLDWRQQESGPRKRLGYLIPIILGCLTLWLLNKAQSSTAIACTFLGGLIIWGAGFPTVRNRLKWFMPLSAGLAIALLCLNLLFDLVPFMVQFAGRDMTLTGRTEIWNAVLKEGTDPLIGAGFYSFWLGDRNERLSRSAHFYYDLGTAHNSYIETYLNSGWVGLLLLFGVLIAAANRIKSLVARGDPLARFRLGCLIAVIPYGFTETCFNRLSLIWFLLLLSIIEYPRPLPAVAVTVRNSDTSS